LLVELLDGTNPVAEGVDTWSQHASLFEQKLGGKCKIESAALSPTGKHLVASCEVRTMLGFRTNQAGGVIDCTANAIIGRLVTGKRTGDRWSLKET
jgi:hypothetical protein